MLNQLFQLIMDIIEGMFRFLFEFIETAVSGFKKNNHSYNADFMPAGRLLSSRNKGFCLTGRRNLSVKDSYQNSLIIGGTGVGKSSVVLIPSLYSMQSSFIIHDPSGELFSKTSGFLNANGCIVKVLNFTNPISSSGYNPLIRANSNSDIQKVASLLIETSLGRGKDPFWIPG